MELTAIKGDTTIYQCTITDQDGAVVNLTGSTVFFTVKQNQTDLDTAALIKKDITSHTNAAGGITRITLTPTDTNLTPGVYFYDIQVKSFTGSIQSITSDVFRVTQDTTVRTA